MTEIPSDEDYKQFVDEHILDNVDVRKINGARFSDVKKEVAGVTYETFKTWASGVWEV